MRIAIVGLGNAASTLHLPALAGISSVSVVGGCDFDAARRERAAQRYRIPVFADFTAMLSDGRPDVVIVGTPPDSHAEYCLRSFAAGAHVICEKPFVSSLEEAGPSDSTTNFVKCLSSALFVTALRTKPPMAPYSLKPGN